MICDICGKTMISSDVITIPCKKMQKAVQEGFSPFKTRGTDTSSAMGLVELFGMSKEQVYQTWRQRALSDTTDWGLCRTCAEAFSKATTPSYTQTITSVPPATEKTPGPRDYSEMLVSLLNADGKYADFERQVIADPVTAEKFFWLGAAALVSANREDNPGLLDKSIRYFEKALDIDPDNKNYYAKLIGAYTSRKDDDGVIRTAKRWAKIDPDLPPEARKWLDKQERSPNPIENIYPDTCKPAGLTATTRGAPPVISGSIKSTVDLALSSVYDEVGKLDGEEKLALANRLNKPLKNNEKTEVVEVCLELMERHDPNATANLRNLVKRFLMEDINAQSSSKLQIAKYLLIKSGYSGNWQEIRRIAIDIMRGMGDAAIDELVSEVIADNHRFDAGRCLRRLGPPAVTKLIYEFTHNRDTNAKWRLATELGFHEDIRVVEPLIEALNDPDEMVREQSSLSLKEATMHRFLFGNKNPVKWKKWWEQHKFGFPLKEDQLAKNRKTISF